MKKLLSLEIGPNYQYDDGLIALKSLFYSPKKYQTKVGKWFLDQYKTSNVWTFDTCRAGIYSILKSFDLENESEVLVQGFSCIVVPNAVLQAGLKPIICDVSEVDFNFDLDQIESKITPKTKVWILQYNFGIIPDMHRVKQICEKHNLILLEDCAHSLGGKFTVDSQEFQVGNFGHAAAFSFGRDKIISTTTGGSVIFNQKPGISVDLDYNQAVKDFDQDYQKLHKMESRKIRQNLLYAILTAFIIKPLYYAGIGKIVAKITTTLKLTGQVYNSAEKNLKVADFPEPRQFSQKLYPLLWNQITKLDKSITHRQQIAKIYTQSLGLQYISGSVYMRFPVYLADLTKSSDIELNRQKYNQILTQSKAKGYFLGKWYNRVFLGSSIDDQGIYNYDESEIQNISILIQNQVLNLPTNIDTTETDALEIVKIIKTILYEA